MRASKHLPRPAQKILFVYSGKKIFSRAMFCECEGGSIARSLCHFERTNFHNRNNSLAHMGRLFGSPLFTSSPQTLSICATTVVFYDVCRSRTICAKNFQATEPPERNLAFAHLWDRTLDSTASLWYKA